MLGMKILKEIYRQSRRRDTTYTKPHELDACWKFTLPVSDLQSGMTANSKAQAGGFGERELGLHPAGLEQRGPPPVFPCTCLS